jgi:PhnB protein
MQLTPYLIFDGTCREAFAFYHQLLGGTIETMPFAGTPAEAHVPPDWRDKIMHTCLKTADAVLMGSDAMPNGEHKAGNTQVALAVADPAEAERIFSALAAGGQVSMPIGPTFWSVRFGMLTDRFGIAWMVNCTQEPAVAA